MSYVPLRILAVCFVTIFSVSCTSTTVVLMPDPDGHVGQVEVSTKAGSQVLLEAGQMTTVASAKKAPAPVSVMSDEKVASMFAEAMAVEPLQPQKFMLFFQPDSIDLVADSVAQINEVLAEIERRGSVDIGIHGHTDRAGSKEYNDDLSLRRAQAVRNLLVERGVDGTMIETASHGEGNPVVPTSDNVAEPRNRRVEVVVR